MYRCIQLALKGKGYTSPNPMVGAVVVYKNTIIGEGYHRKAGEGHAEVNAIASVKNKELLKESTLYVSLEPCSHHGKTPPCAQLIIDSQIPNVVIGCLDPFPEVSGRGIKMLHEAGIKTKVGVMEQECQTLNKEFITSQTLSRPYIYLKWAQSADGFMDRKRTEENTTPTVLSNDFTKILVHKLRAETDAIMVGTNTAIADNPSLTTRLWNGKNPIRIIIDRTLRIPQSYNIYNASSKTIIITAKEDLPTNAKNIEFICIKFDEQFLSHLFSELCKRGIQSIMIEGGGKLLSSIIDAKMWDEAFVETTGSIFNAGTPAPKIDGKLIDERFYKQSKRLHFVESTNLKIYKY